MSISSPVTTSNKRSISSPRSRTPRRNVRRDYFSNLPPEVFSEIMSHVDNSENGTDLRTWKQISRVSKRIRSLCIKLGLFSHVSLTPRHGTGTVLEFYTFLKSNKFLPASIYSLTIDTYLLLPKTPRFSHLYRVLQELPELTTLRLRGTERAELIKGGPLLIEDGLLHSTLSSRKYLKKLRRLVIENVVITRTIMNIICALPVYQSLDIVECAMITTGPCAPAIPAFKIKSCILALNLSMSRRSCSELYYALRLSKLARSLTFLSFSSERSLLHFLLDPELLFPALKTLLCKVRGPRLSKILPEDTSIMFRHKLLNFVWVLTDYPKDLKTQLRSIFARIRITRYNFLFSNLILVVKVKDAEDKDYIPIGLRIRVRDASGAGTTEWGVVLCANTELVHKFFDAQLDHDPAVMELRKMKRPEVDTILEKAHMDEWAYLRDGERKRQRTGH